MCFISLGASDSQVDRVNMCMRARQKYINNYTTKQYTAGSEWREVGRIQVEGWDRDEARRITRRSQMNFTAVIRPGYPEKCRKGLYSVGGREVGKPWLKLWQKNPQRFLKPFAYRDCTLKWNARIHAKDRTLQFGILIIQWECLFYPNLSKSH